MQVIAALLLLVLHLSIAIGKMLGAVFFGTLELFRRGRRRPEKPRAKVIQPFEPPDLP